MQIWIQNRSLAASKHAIRRVAVLLTSCIAMTAIADAQTSGSSCDCIWNSSFSAITVHPLTNGSFGQIAFDGNCDLLVAGARSRAIYKVDHLSGAVSTLASNFAHAVTCVLYRRSDGLVYGATGDLLGGRIFRVNRDGAVTFLTFDPGLYLSMALAPDSFGPFANQLIISRYPGRVIAFDPDTLSVTELAETLGNISGLVFDRAGFLYAANNSQGTIQVLWPDGTFTDPVHFGPVISGLAIDPLGSRLFVVAGNKIQQASLEDSAVKSLGAGPYAGDIRSLGLLVDAGGHLLVKNSSNSNAVIDFVTVNAVPSAIARLRSLFAASPDETNLYVLALNSASATVILDGSQSSDADNEPLQFAWHVDGETNVLATCAVTTNQFTIGAHTIKLIVSDGHDTAKADVNFEVISPATAVRKLAQLLEQANLGTKNKQPLVASLNAAISSFDGDNLNAALNQLSAFENKVRAQMGGSNPDLAAQLIGAAEQILAVVGEP